LLQRRLLCAEERDYSLPGGADEAADDACADEEADDADEEPDGGPDEEPDGPDAAVQRGRWQMQ
jgi:hypothetical protein